ncbi:MAG: type I glyceraldehyde-3-phosphate dehydrogenase, partial [Deltaproteobacteria bacterium]|nr:type I glyceraldehyde-3-phosphate dehydrogenase [Deltaproteobacteria bacterium]
MPIKVAINGFGRIGRNILRNCIDDKDIEFVAINDITDEKTLAHLLKFDSVFGVLPAEVSGSDGCINVSGRCIRVLAERDPSKLPWKELDVDIVLECTGLF